MPPRLPPQVRSTLGDLADGLRSALDGHVAALYLGGSAVLGDFQDATSDLNFLAVVEGDMGPEALAVLASLHDALRATTPYGGRLEGAYAPLTLLAPGGTGAPVPRCHRGRLDGAGAPVTAEVLYHVRERGFTLHGPEPKRLLPRTSEADARAAVLARLREAAPPAATPAAAAAAPPRSRSGRCWRRGRTCWGRCGRGTGEGYPSRKRTPE